MGGTNFTEQGTPDEGGSLKPLAPDTDLEAATKLLPILAEAHAKGRDVYISFRERVPSLVVADKINPVVETKPLAPPAA